jgi:3-oxoadipate enol-lactonase
MRTLQLVTLHGALLDFHMWDPLWDALDYEVAFERTDLTLPGHTDDPGDLSPEPTHEVSALLLQALEALGPGTVVLLGHSWGAMVALDLAARYPDRVQGLILIETSWGTSTTPGERLGTILARGLLRVISPATLARMAAADYGRHSPSTKAYVASTASRLGSTKIRAIMNAVFAFDIRDSLASITQPTLVIVGERNKRTHAQARKLEQALPRASVVTITDAGHLPMLDQPEQTAAVIAGFLRAQNSF